MNIRRKIKLRILVILGMIFTRVLSTTFPYFFINRATLIILKARITVTVVEMSIPMLNQFIAIPKLVPMTIKKSNQFQDDMVKYLQE